MKRIVLIGPESTGKTSLAKALAEDLREVWVPEFARNYLDELGRAYEESDLLAIAKGQVELEDRLAEKANQFLFCDTNLIVIKIWSEYKYGRCTPWILEQIEQRSYDLYLLCGTDIPWEYDPLREHPEQREELYTIYESELRQLDSPFLKIEGNLQERLKKAQASLLDLGKNH